VTGAFFQPGAVTVQECTAAWAAAPDLATAADSCGAAKTVTAAGDGTFSATASVTDPLVTRSGTSVPCGASGCVLVASSASDPAVTRALLVFGGPSLRVGQTQGLLDEQEVPITITGVEPGTVVDVGLCVTPAPGAEADCAAFSGELAVGPDGTGGGVLDAHRGFAYPRVSGLPSDCRVVGCSIIAFDRDTHAQLGRDVPVTFGPRPVVSLTPTTGLLEGQPMTFRAANLPPNQPFYVARCVDGRCPSPERVISSPTGTVDRTVAASERIGTRWLCHGRCTVRLQSGPWFDSADPSVGYTTASGSVTVTPSTGLVDEQSVTVTGSNLLATYAGPTILFPTGGWGLSQCDRAVGSTPTLVDVFTHCAIPPGGGVVTVPGSTSSTTIAAQATITKILGGTTDCTTSAGACVVGLFRWEQDGTVSAHTTPISFAGAP
jgi:hypothetical protein